MADPERALLDLLNASPASEIPLDRAAGAIGGARAEVEALVAWLRARARLVEVVRGESVRLDAAPRPLSASSLRARRPGSIGFPRVLLDEVDSTNAEALRRVDRGEARHGLLVCAEAQAAGRGRGGHRWFSPRGTGLWFSVVARPDLPGERVPWITQAAGLGVARGVERATGIRALLKWPNDLLVGGRKVAGLLTESVTRGPELAVVAGIGIDVNPAPGDFPAELAGVATSLRIQAGAPLDRAAVLDAVLDGLEEAWGALRRGDVAALDRGIAERSAVLGRRVRLLEGARPHEGVVVEQSLAGGLVLETGPGARCAFRGEHVHSVELA
jgi:BirA family biotin operon repressor/biotin-[acetyl-CoA-carboxylase] ligase